MPKTVTARGELRRESGGERIGERVGDRVLAVLASTYEAVQLDGWVLNVEDDLQTSMNWQGNHPVLSSL